MSSLDGPSSSERIKEPKYDAIVVLGAAMKWDKDAKRWDFPTIVEKEIYPAHLVMGKARAIAASEVQEQGEKMLVTGGGQKNPETEEWASRAEELTKLITEKYHVPKETIIPIGTAKAGSVMGNVENVVTYLKDNPEILKRHKIAILSPRFQQERAEMMFKANPYFKENTIEVVWITVEDILEQRHPLYKKWAQAVASTDEAAVAEEMEAQGRKDFAGDTYKPKSDTSGSS